MGKAPKRATGSTTAHAAFVNQCKLAVDLFYATKFEVITVRNEPTGILFSIERKSALETQQCIYIKPRSTVDGPHFIKSDRIIYSLLPSGNVIMSMMVANLNKLPQLIDILLKEKVAFELLN